MTTCHQTGETEDHLGILLAQRDKSNHRLDEGNPRLERPKQERKLLEEGNQIRRPMTISEEEDEDSHLNSTQNPLDDTDLAVLIASITGEMDDEAWINSKVTMATKIQAEINAKKKILPIKEQIPKEFHEFLDIFDEEKAA